MAEYIEPTSYMMEAVPGTGDGAAAASMFGGSGAGFAASFMGKALDTLFMIPQGFLNNWISGEQYKDRMSTNYEYSKKLIDYQNAYNSPKAQMQRLAEAGLNPNLIYGSNAPSGQSGSSEMSASTQPGPSFTTADIASSALAMAQMRQAEAARENLTADARLKNAEAANREMYNERYNEVLDYQIKNASKQLEKLASDINVNYREMNYKLAQTRLAEAETAFRNGEIGLQSYRKQQLVAQTILFMSESKLKEAQTSLTWTQDYNWNIQNALDSLELKYKQYFYNSDGTMKELSEKERSALKAKFEYDAARYGAQIGIAGSKSAAWTEFVFDRIATLTGAGSAMGGAAKLASLP